jgi:hypothetical protein
MLQGVKKDVVKAQTVADEAQTIARNNAQYFWFLESDPDATGVGTGAHITETPKETFMQDPSNGGGNLLARSNGIAVRDGLTELATFGATGARIGQTSSTHMDLDDGSLAITDSSNNRRMFLGKPSVITAVREIQSKKSTSFSYAMSHTIDTSNPYSCETLDGDAVTITNVIGNAFQISYSGTPTAFVFDYYTTDEVFSYIIGNGVQDRYGVESVSESLGQAYGDYSHAEGNAIAGGKYSHANGDGTMAVGNAQTVIGKYNDTEYYAYAQSSSGGGVVVGYKAYPFVIGNGADDSSRSNALAVTWEGDVIMSINENETFTGSVDYKLYHALSDMGWT